MSRTSVFVLSIAVCARIVLAAENAGSENMREFAKRVSAYAQLRKSVESNVPRLKATGSEAKIAAGEQELARLICEARKSAQPGDIFTPPIASDFRRLIGMAMKAQGKQIKASLQHAEPVELRLRVNDNYPANIPLESTPPSLLDNLPRLPRQMEYRVAGHDLILLDTSANLVVDLISGAIP